MSDAELTSRIMTVLVAIFCYKLTLYNL